MRPEIRAFLDLGPLPSEDADLEKVERAENALMAISAPLTDTEAEALLVCFGEGDCFGLAWTLLHLIESSPSAASRKAPSETANAWVQLLFERTQGSV